jgi:diaminopropionate ammonia-lyase
LPNLAKKLGISALYYKDESTRFGLKSFKALGGAYAVFRLIQKAVALQHNGHLPSPQEILSGRYADIISKMTVTCATDGNHGRSVAWGAQLFGCRCVIYIHATVSEGRRAAIAFYGAEVIRVQGNYDDSVHHAASEAAKNGWTVVSDTTYEGYRDIPIDVMHGYGVMSREIVKQLHDAPPTHVLVQAGVGALAASVCATFWQKWGAARPKFIIIEPEHADCFFQSGQVGHPVIVTGDLETVMAGLACGEVSPVAWDILKNGIDCYATLADKFALEGMRVLANPIGDDPKIVSGETGSTGLGLLMAAQGNNAAWNTLGLGPESRVLMIGSEGDTDPTIYKQVVGRTAEEVLA